MTASTGVTVGHFKLVFIIGTVTYPTGTYAGGYIIDRCSPMLYLFFVTGAFCTLHTLVPFMPEFYTVLMVYVVNESFMGMVDTGE